MKKNNKMSSKIKPRQQKFPRNMIAKDSLGKKNQPMKDRREKRSNNPNNKNWNQSFED